MLDLTPEYEGLSELASSVLTKARLDRMIVTINAAHVSAHRILLAPKAKPSAKGSEYFSMTSGALAVYFHRNCSPCSLLQQLAPLQQIRLCKQRSHYLYRPQWARHDCWKRKTPMLGLVRINTMPLRRHRWGGVKHNNDLVRRGTRRPFDSDWSDWHLLGRISPLQLPGELFRPQPSLHHQSGGRRQ